DLRSLALLAGALVALDDVHALDEDAVVLVDDGANGALLAAVLPGEHDDLIATLDFRRHYSTSGASETIFMKFRSRSSRATGPKMRVPRGFSPSLASSTAAFSSKRMYEPSGRPYSFVTRTTTALTT